MFAGVLAITATAWNVSKYGVFSGPNTGKYGPEITPYLDTFHTVCLKTIHIWSLSCPYFPAFGLNKCGKIQTRKTPNTDTFHAVHVTVLYPKISETDHLWDVVWSSFSGMLCVRWEDVPMENYLNWLAIGNCLLK